MIHSITANHSSFHTVRFTPGLNIVVADRTEESTQKDTRNGLGKSTLVNIIDFCLGSRVSKGRGLAIAPLQGWEFTMEMTVAGNRVRVTRAIDKPNRIVVEGSTKGWIEQPDSPDASGTHSLEVTRWKGLLGWAWFGLPAPNKDIKYRPSFRSLISYFVRRGGEAYLEPFRHTSQQATWDKQLHTAFLLGMNWENATRWQELRDEEKVIRAIDQAFGGGSTAMSVVSVGELEAERIQLERQLEQESGALQEFRVHPQYDSIQSEVDALTTTIHDLVNKNVTERRRLARYRESIDDEVAPTSASIELIYEEAGVIFGESVRRTLAEAKQFHLNIVANRRSFLETEVNRLERTVESRDAEIRALSDRRADLLGILETHGALSELTSLQERIVQVRSKLEKTREWISQIRDRKSRLREVKVRRAEIARVAEQDHDERRGFWSVAIRLFDDNSQALYETSGHLVIDIDETGFRYNVEINKSGSEGVGKMKIFCFDLMLLQMMSRQRTGPDFLVHDSILYDGVDSRQRALALERADEVSRIGNTQYICTFNSDMVPREDFSREFDFGKYVRLTLTDKDPAGSLLGFHFELPEK